MENATSSEAPLSGPEFRVTSIGFIRSRASAAAVKEVQAVMVAGTTVAAQEAAQEAALVAAAVAMDRTAWTRILVAVDTPREVLAIKTAAG